MKFNAKLMALVICTCLVAACLPTDQSIETPIQTSSSKHRVSFTDKTKVKVHSQIKLANDVSAGFNKFRTTGGLYGAMFVTKDGQSFSWKSRRFSVEDAMAAAQVDCEAFYQQSCVLHATLGPASLVGGNVFIPDKNWLTWEKALRETQAGNYIAIATNKTGASGFAWDFSTVSEARTAAIKTCKGNRTAKSKEAVARVVSANEAAGIYDCRIFGTFR